MLLELLLRRLVLRLRLLKLLGKLWLRQLELLLLKRFRWLLRLLELRLLELRLLELRLLKLRLRLLELLELWRQLQWLLLLLLELR